MRLFFLFLGCAFFLLPCIKNAEALDEKISDLSVSAEIAPVFSLYLDNPNLSFGLISPGQEKILGEGRFFNEVRCRSNSGRTWQLKAQLNSLRLLEKNYSLPLSNLGWRVAESTGSAEPISSSGFQQFSGLPALIYISQGDDLRGKEVVLRFQYRLYSPVEAPSGNYTGEVVFTMTESL